MSAATLSAPHLEVTAPDTMDLHSDDGLGFDDGDVDIDLDLRSTGGADDDDDDESLRDAATDAGQDMQTVPGDQDDFMADEEDLIEEDAVDEDVEKDFDLHSTDHAIALELPQPADQEEDLIDYSDDEDAAVDRTPVASNAPQTDDRDGPVVGGEGEGGAFVDDSAGLGDNIEQHAAGSLHAVPALEEQNESATVQEQESYATQQPGDAPTQLDDQSRHDVHDDQDTLGQETPSSEHGENDPTVSLAATGAQDSTTEQGTQNVQGSYAHPVNVNFNGKDYWLLRHHDYEGSGDYLLENDSFLKQPLHVVIDACREALGALDVSVPSDLELGFRLDSLHHVELYEEHSTCAFFSLNDILRVYLQLYSQDGITDPDYFCVTLLSRPRVSSLLAELSRAATEGIGYSGLDNVIVSGQSLFSIHNSHSPTEHSFGEWEADEVQEASKAQSYLEASEQDGHDGEDHENLEREEIQGPYEDEEEEEEHGDEGWPKETKNEPEPKPEPEYAADVSEDTATAAVSASDNATFESATAIASEPVRQSVVDTAVSERDPQDPQDDFLDYSDDEDDEDAPGKQTQTSGGSSASATVQGDDSAQTQDSAENVGQDEQQGGHDEQAGLGADGLVEYEGDDYSYEEFDQQAYGEPYEEGYGQDYTEGQKPEGHPSYDVAEANVEHTNHVDDLEQRPGDHADELYVTAESNVCEPDAVDDAFEGANDFLEFDDIIAAPQETVNNDAAEDELDYSDEEDGVGSQAPVAASAAADNVVASSTEPQNLSPQGQKRTIDEVSNDVVDATTSTDAKRPRV